MLLLLTFLCVFVTVRATPPPTQVITVAPTRTVYAPGDPREAAAEESRMLSRFLELAQKVDAADWVWTQSEQTLIDELFDLLIRTLWPRINVAISNNSPLPHEQRLQLQAVGDKFQSTYSELKRRRDLLYVSRPDLKPDHFQVDLPPPGVPQIVSTMRQENAALAALLPALRAQKQALLQSHQLWMKKLRIQRSLDLIHMYETRNFTQGLSVIGQRQKELDRQLDELGQWMVVNEERRALLAQRHDYEDEIKELQRLKYPHPPEDDCLPPDHPYPFVRLPCPSFNRGY